MNPRAPSQQEYSELLKFLNETLRPKATWSIQNEYPTALSQENIHNIRIIKEGNQVLSHALVKPHILKTPSAIYKIGAIGSVVTHSEYRNQGLSKKVLEDCIKVCEQQDCDLAVLWTNLFDFYQKFGFTLAGYEITLTINENFALQHKQNLRILKSTQVDPNALLKLMNQHTVMTVRTAEEVRRFMNIPSSQIYTAWDSNSQLCAYAVEGKGADLSGYIHEWGGSVSALCEVFKHIQTEKKQDIHIISPNHSKNLIHTLESLGATKNTGFLAMIKMIDEDGLFKKIHKYAKLSLGISNLVLEKMNNEYRIGTTQQYLSTPSSSDIILLLFGPNNFSDIQGLESAAKSTLSKIFPLPLWLWGWDSI